MIEKGSILVYVHDAHRNEQVNIVALSRGIQTILCSSLKPNKYYVLLPMLGGPETGKNKFELSRQDEQRESEIHNKFGASLERFQLKFIAKEYRSYSMCNNTEEFWEEMRSEGLFPLWDPVNGPMKYFDKFPQSKLQILRVYSIDRDLSEYVKLIGRFFVPTFVGPPQQVKAEPIKTDDEISKEADKLEAIPSHHGYCF